MGDNSNSELGLARGTVSVVPHNDEWEVTGRKTIAKLKELLGDTAVDIQHVGSTSIKGIYAKPIIDLVIGVNDFASRKTLFSKRTASFTAGRTFPASISTSAERAR